EIPRRSEVGLVGESRRVEGLAVGFGGPVHDGELSQLVRDERHEGGRCGGVAGSGSVEEASRPGHSADRIGDWWQNRKRSRGEGDSRTVEARNRDGHLAAILAARRLAFLNFSVEMSKKRDARRNSSQYLKGKT